MPDLAMIAFPAAVFVGNDFGSTILGQNLGHNLGPGDNGFAHLHLGILGEKEDIRNLGGGAGFTRKTFHLKGIAFANLILFSTCPDDGEGWHKLKIVSQKWRTGKKDCGDGAGGEQKGERGDYGSLGDRV